MNRISTLVAAALGLAVQASAQAPAIKVDIKEVKLEQQLTPMFQAAGVVEKRWKPKAWIEIDTELKIKLPRAEGGEDASASALEIRYFVATNGKNKEGKPIVITGSINYQNIPADDSAHALAYVSPSMLKKVLMRDGGTKADTPAVGIDVYYAGQPVATAGSRSGRWWVDASDPATPNKQFDYQEGVQPKADTPFAIMFGDYDLEVSKK